GMVYKCKRKAVDRYSQDSAMHVFNGLQHHFDLKERVLISGSQPSEGRDVKASKRASCRRLAYSARREPSTFAPFLPNGVRERITFLSLYGRCSPVDVLPSIRPLLAAT